MAADVRGKGEATGKHVLVVDDEVHVRRLVELHLRHAGYRVTTAADGLDALNKIGADRPDLIISDVIMPQLDGIEMLRRLKADPGTEEIPVLMLTVKALSADVVPGWNSGACHYLTKPFHPAELLATVAGILAPQAGPTLPAAEAPSK